MSISNPVRGYDLPGLMTGEVPEKRDRRQVPITRRTIKSLSLVIPAKNEAAGLPGLLEELNGVLAQREGLRYEILLIDDGSTDETAEIGLAAGARVITHPESLGNGAAVKRGIREAQMDWVVLLDGDGQHPPDQLPELIRLAESRYDMVVGSRGGSGGSVHRNLANRIYNGLASYVTNRPIPDLTSGYRLIRADVVKGFCYLLPNTFSYPTTITLAMMRAGYSVGFAPIEVRERQGKSHIRVIRDGTRFLIIILRIATRVHAAVCRDVRDGFDLVRDHLLYRWPVHEHGRSAVHAGIRHLRTRPRLRAGRSAPLPTIRRRLPVVSELRVLAFGAWDTGAGYPRADALHGLQEPEPIPLDNVKEAEKVDMILAHVGFDLQRQGFTRARQAAQGSRRALH